MKQDDAIDAFSALAHETRLAVFRLLVREGPKGVPALEIARRLTVKPSTLSGHLSILKRAELVTATRRQKEILYAPNFASVDSLVRFLLQDCCGGDATACAPDASTPAGLIVVKDS
ncbi:helix-turn-helix transcriptional regulator [Salipiger sp. PrR002]|uniref:ArsR/SmtB family transcription factor n=1 Tax=Salipiger sp. PrR002 TaxID=2706489 RepID=UPI0013B65093|nr:metalloregulator ArsR/SmtB family transcription factor [Salipiger sp. PrR002]NDW02740.1 helix-turn-helix transcriptional regulator [Salipiger sp. PrR002]NDW59999.1 helix-turn-helix transcriptional regulator [Salipiger sp. PrR004]